MVRFAYRMLDATPAMPAPAIPVAPPLLEPEFEKAVPVAPPRDPPQSSARPDDAERPFLAWLPQDLPWPLVGAGLILFVRGDEETVARNARWVALWTTPRM